jgi:hypothetical protein
LIFAGMVAGRFVPAAAPALDVIILGLTSQKAIPAGDEHHAVERRSESGIDTSLEREASHSTIVRARERRQTSRYWREKLALNCVM